MLFFKEDLWGGGVKLPWPCREKPAPRVQFQGAGVFLEWAKSEFKPALTGEAERAVKRGNVRELVLHEITVWA